MTEREYLHTEALVTMRAVSNLLHEIGCVGALTPEKLVDLRITVAHIKRDLRAEADIPGHLARS